MGTFTLKISINALEGHLVDVERCNFAIQLGTVKFTCIFVSKEKLYT